MADKSSEPQQDMFHDIGEQANDVGGRSDGLTVSEDGVTSMESLCMNCEEQGVTNLLLTRVPFFRNIILMSFTCPHCGYRSNEIQAAEVQERGSRFVLHVTSKEDLNRQIIKSDKATVSIPALEFEIPPQTQPGVFSTIEGILHTSIENLQTARENHAEQSPELAAQLTEFIAKLTMYMTGIELPFDFILDDPTGNSFIENPIAPKPDPHMEFKQYHRSKAQNEAIGMFADNSTEGAATRESYGGLGHKPKAGGLIHTETDRARAGVTRDESGRVVGLNFDSSATDMTKEVMKFPVECYACGAPGEQNMCVTDIPHFKEIILMAFNCDECGWKNVEVKGGGAVPDHGTVLELKVEPGATFAEDMGRDVIKGDTASICIPEIDLEVTRGSLGGMYTTVEGLLDTIRERFVESNPFAHAAVDSADRDRTDAFKRFVDDLASVIKGERPFTLLIQDPMANSWIYSPFDDLSQEEVEAAGGGSASKDPRLTKRDVKRTREEDLAMGLLDMKVDNYEALDEAIPEGDEEADEPEEGEAAAAAEDKPTGAGKEDDAAKEGSATESATAADTSAPSS